MGLGFLRQRTLQISFLLTFFIGLFGFPGAKAQDGKALFNTNCATCHHPIKNSTGPALQGVKAAWEDNAEEGLIYIWVNNWEQAAGMSSYAAEVAKKKSTAMDKFNLTNEQIDAILDYVDAYEEAGVAAGGAAGGTMTAAEEEEGGVSVWWYVIGSVLLVVIFAAASTRRQLAILDKKQDEEEVDEQDTYVDILREWVKKNGTAVSVMAIIAFFALSVVSYGWFKDIGVVAGYHPSQPIEFNHSIHAGINEIDCQYCHNSASKSRHAGIPTMNVCMNCHKYVDGASEEGKKDVERLRAAAGYNATTVQYSGEVSPIVWNKVHVLPDHAYFNHAQHVNVGGLDCKNCHGDVATYTTGRVANVEDLIPLGDNEENRLTKPTLTMGWCIECHGNAGVGLQGNGDYYEEIHRRLKNRPDVYKKYLDDEKITVRELGGWECAKCHY